MLGILTRPIHARRENYRSIDILRGLAALAILVFHADHFGMGGGSLSRVPDSVNQLWLFQFLAPVRHYGALSVMLFWAISGFVFMNIYADRKPDVRTFLVNRISRLYPLHLLTLVIVALIQLCAIGMLGHYLIYRTNDVYHFILQLFFASEWGLQHGRSFNGPIWSVSVEVLIYAIFYLFVRFVPVNLVLSGVVLVAFAVLFRYSHNNQIALCGVFFFGGAFVYACYAALHPRLRPAAAVAALVGIAALSTGLWTIGPDRFPLTFWLLPIFGLVLVVLAISEGSSAMSAFYRRLRFLGDITYSTYLWHSPLQMLFLLGAGLGWWSVDVAYTSLFMIGYLLFVMAFAYASFRWIERPAQAFLRRRLLTRPAPISLISAP